VCVCEMCVRLISHKRRETFGKHAISVIALAF